MARLIDWSCEHGNESSSSIKCWLSIMAELHEVRVCKEIISSENSTERLSCRGVLNGKHQSLSLLY
jgi:hypothetical protein